MTSEPSEGPVAGMEERERLWRQIQLLQGLINDHKTAHGDTPRLPPPALPRWNRPGQPPFRRRGTYSTRYSHQALRDFQQCWGHAWRKKYSLVNRLPGSTCNVGSTGTSRGFGSSGDNQASEPSESSPERHVGLTTDGNIVVGIQLPHKAAPFRETTEALGSGASYQESSGLQTAAGASGHGGTVQASPCTSQNEERRSSLSISFNSSHRFVSTVTVSVLEKPRVVCASGEGAAAGSPSEGAVTLKSEPQEPPVLSEFSAVVQHLLQRKVEPPTSSCQQVVSGDAAELKPLGRGQTGSRPAQTTGSAAGVTPVRSRFNVAPRAAGVPRAASTPISSKAPKFRKTNYTWVANPAKCSRPVRRWVSPRPSENLRKGTGAAERAAKPSPRGDVGAKLKKSVVQTKAGVCASKYKWKASNLQASPSTSRSAFRWRCEDQKKPPALSLPLTGTVPLPPGAAAVGPSAVKPVGAAALSSYKVRSRTKIIKRKGNLGSPTEKKSSSSSTTPLKSHFHLRKKVLRGKTSTPLKRSSPKGLVHITKHRLCRLQVSTKEGANLHFVRSSPASKVIKTRYRIIKKNVVSPAVSSFGSPVPSWKLRRPVTSRSPLLNQSRPSPQGGKSLHVQQRWRSKGYRCIGGVMYQVSANKLSKTSSTPGRGRDLSTKSPGRAAARGHCLPSPGFSPAGCLNRSATSRYIASRAVQRSLAIIRQAKQKKKKKEYCMYYNRFGKCNRGESCPYIHDPEKVAVCTRFLRGTCKKTDGTCPFSHQVSKDKMPVCSYFLKGICSNSNCPYSHVYVSRKAEVCQDFLKGYCPMGEKCKKKHTLVCPDFTRRGVCPRGARCKLLHPQKKGRSRKAEDGNCSYPLPKWRRLLEEADRKDPPPLHDDGEVPGPSGAEQEVKFWKEENTSPTSWLRKLPSFISLQSPASPSGRGCKVEQDDEEKSQDEPGSGKRKRASPPASSRAPRNTALDEGGRGKQLQIKPRL